MSQFDDVQDFVRLARSSETVEELHALVDGAARSFGFAYFILGHHTTASGPGVVYLSSYPSGFVEEMSRRTRFHDDPVMRACRTTAAGFRWAELGRLIALTGYQKDILAGARRAGIGEGFTVPVHIPGERQGSSSFAVRQGQRFDERVLPAAHYLGSAAFEVARRLANAQAPASRVTMSPRQRECIVLVAQGKSDWEIGRLLSLSKATVHEYVENAKRKYGVASRVQLVAKALFDEQIGFDDIIRH
ncbi:MAG: LuxR family transcriptional regulator [Alphaproteobacteria bacterium]|nr:LuxR family transcriptional regulator [Alphaproteobacteria bacterium]